MISDALGSSSTGIHIEILITSTKYAHSQIWVNTGAGYLSRKICGAPRCLRVSCISERRSASPRGGFGWNWRLKMHRLKDYFFENNSLLCSSMASWGKSLFLIRCSVFVAAISAIGLMVWYGQKMTTSFVETHLLPSVCSVLSEHLRREFDFGRVRSVSPFSISLESCSMGPHSTEFSCGEVAGMKIRVRPFASLKRGRIVIDAVVSQPLLVIAQREDFSWFGLSSTSGNGFTRHRSTEEGIDYRTKTRRLAREEAVARSKRERDLAAKEAAEEGYFISGHESGTSASYEIQHHLGYSAKSSPSSSVFCTDKRMHWKDHHCSDSGIEHPMKHVDMNEFFGAGVQRDPRRIWSRFVGSFMRSNRKHITLTRDTSGAGITIKRRNLDRSKAAALAYFLNRDAKKFEASAVQQEGSSSVMADDDSTGQSSSNALSKVKERNGNEPINATAECKTMHPSKHLLCGAIGRNYKTKHHAKSSSGSDCSSHEDSSSRSGLETKQGSGHRAKLGRDIIQSEGVHVHRSQGKLGIWICKAMEDFGGSIAQGFAGTNGRGTGKILPFILDSVCFSSGTLMLLGYGDKEPREIENVQGHVKFQDQHRCMYVQMTGSCKAWRLESSSGHGGYLSTDLFVDLDEHKWHANLSVADFYVPLFERILDIPIVWYQGRASGEIHVCMPKGGTFPDLHGQLDVDGLAFQIFDAPAGFTETTATLCFNGQQTFLRNANGIFGDIPLEASGNFGLNPQSGELHLMCQVPSVEINALARTLRMKQLMVPVVGFITAAFNCQGPLDAPIFMGSGIISRKTVHSVTEYPVSSASETLLKNRDAGAVAAVDRIPFTYASANFTFDVDNSVADFYGIRANLLNGGEIRGGGNAWLCPEGEVDDSALNINLSGNVSVGPFVDQYLPFDVKLATTGIEELNGETKVSGSLLKPRFDVKWAAPKAEESFAEARGNVIVTYDHITMNASSIAFDLSLKVHISYPDECATRVNERNFPFLFVEGVDLDLRMHGFQFLNVVSPYFFDTPRPRHLKATGRVRFQGKMVKELIRAITDRSSSLWAEESVLDKEDRMLNLSGEISLSGLTVNQLVLAPLLRGSLRISEESVKLYAVGKPDENLAVEVVGWLWPANVENMSRRRVSASLQKGQLKVQIYYQPHCSTNLELRHLPLDELELASLRGVVQRAELQLNFQKRKGYGLLNVLRPKFSGMMGESLELAARWSGDVITVEKIVLVQTISKYELHGEYVLPGLRDRYPVDMSGGLLGNAVVGHLEKVISSMGRWRLRLEVPVAEVSELFPLAQLLSHSTDPTIQLRSKDYFMQNLHLAGFYGASLRELLEVVRGHYASSDDVVLERSSTPGLAELRGRWHGSIDASGGGNGDTVAEFALFGEDWEWGSNKTERVEAEGSFNSSDGLCLDQLFIQKDDATLHADGSVLGPQANLHFAVLNFPVDLVPTVMQVIGSSSRTFQSLLQVLATTRGILHMEGDLRGNLARPECDVQVRLLDGAVGRIDLGRTEIVASITPTSRLIFDANIEPVIQSGHIHIQGSIPVAYIHNVSSEEEGVQNGCMARGPAWSKERDGECGGKFSMIKGDIEKGGWGAPLTERFRGLSWNILDVAEVRIDANVKDGGMMIITALCPYADWLQGNADIFLQVRGTWKHPLFDGSASFQRAVVSSRVLRKPLTNIRGTIHVKSNKLSIVSLESRVSRKGKLLIHGNLPFQAIECFTDDELSKKYSEKIDIKCEKLDIWVKNILSGQVDSQLQVSGSILQPSISGMIKLSRGEAYLSHDKGNRMAGNQFAPGRSILSGGDYDQVAASGPVSPYFGEPVLGEKKWQEYAKPWIDVSVTELKLVFGPQLRMVYPLILNFSVSGELQLNGTVHPKFIRPKGILTFENGDVNLVATQVRLKRGHLNIAKFEPELGLDPVLDLALVGSVGQFRIQGRASNWQDNLVVTSSLSVEPDVVSPSEATRVFESQLAGALLEGNGKLAFEKLATATLETLMPRFEGKWEYGLARWSVVYSPQIPSLHSSNLAEDPLRFLANNILSGTEVEVHLGRRLQASIFRQMKESEMSTQWTLLYQLTSRLRVLVQIPSNDAKRILFEYSATSQD